MTKSGKANKATEEDSKYLKLFNLFNEKVKLLKGEKRSTETEEIFAGLEKISQKRETSAERDATERVLLDRLKVLLRNGSRYLPGPYLQNYGDPLLRNLDSVQKWSSGTVETLAGAVYDHDNLDYRNELHGFLALTSNIYRSFMEPEYLTALDFPTPHTRFPALATFSPTLILPPKSPQTPTSSQKNLSFLPFTLPANEVHRLCGGDVAVVSMPSVYRHHPVLSWGCVAHEVGGHDVLHAFPGLLQELRRGVRELFYKGQDPHKEKLDGEDQFLGLLWQYWTEETAADVLAVMNVGPHYGTALAVYFASLGQQLRCFFTDEAPDGLPALAVSSIFDPGRNIWIVDYHPPTVLSLYAIQGAIDALACLSRRKRQHYIAELDECISVYLKNGNDKVLRLYEKNEKIRTEKYIKDDVSVVGMLQVKAGTWVWMGPPLPVKQIDNHYKVPLSRMKEYARRVGYYIASARLGSLNNHSIQDLETWDDVDETQMENIAQKIANPGAAFELSMMGDDAQMFAGAVCALANDSDPNKYDVVNRNLSEVLNISFMGDPIWGNPFWHRMAGENML